MGSVLAIAYGAATLDRALTRDAVGGLVLQMAFCLVTSTIYFMLPHRRHDACAGRQLQPDSLGPHPRPGGRLCRRAGQLARQEPATVIAGVAVATALMPPLCAAGFGLASANGGLFLTALYEFGVNVVFIALSAEMVLLLLRTPLKRDINDDGVVTEAEDQLIRAESTRSAGASWWGP